MAKTNTYRVKWPLVESLSLLSAPLVLSLAQSKSFVKSVVPLLISAAALLRLITVEGCVTAMIILLPNIRDGQRHLSFLARILRVYGLIHLF